MYIAGLKSGLFLSYTAAKLLKNNTDHSVIMQAVCESTSLQATA